jgi:hypothetical protein
VRRAHGSQVTDVGNDKIDENLHVVIERDVADAPGQGQEEDRSTATTGPGDPSTSGSDDRTITRMRRHLARRSRDLTTLRHSAHYDAPRKLRFEVSQTVQQSQVAGNDPDQSTCGWLGAERHRGAQGTSRLLSKACLFLSGASNCDRVELTEQLHEILKRSAPDRADALKCLNLVTRSLDPKGTGQQRWTMRWSQRSARSRSPSATGCRRRRTTAMRTAISTVDLTGPSWVEN